MKNNKVIIIFFILFFYCDTSFAMVGRAARGLKVSKVPPAVPKAPVQIIRPPRGQVPGPEPTIPSLPSTAPIGIPQLVPSVQIPTRGLQLPPFREEIVSVEIQKKPLMPINPNFFNNIMKARQSNIALGFISEKAAQNLISHDPAYKELFQADETTIKDKEKKRTLFKSEHNNMGYSVQLRKSDVEPTLYTIFGAIEEPHTNFLNAQFPPEVTIVQEQANSESFDSIDTLFKQVLENTTIKQIEQQKAEQAFELAQKKALVERLKAEELKTKQEFQQAQQEEAALKKIAQEKGEAVVELETKIPTLTADIESARQKEIDLAAKEAELIAQREKATKDIAEIEQRERDLAEINELTEKINAELDFESQKVVESLQEEFQKESLVIQNKIDESNQNSERIEQNIRALDKNIETLEQEHQQALNEQAQAQTERELQQAQQKEQDIRTEQQLIKQEQAELQELHNQSIQNKERLKEQEAYNQETYRQQLEALEQEQKEFNETQRLQAQERAQQQELAAEERAETYKVEEEQIMAEELVQREALEQQVAQQITEREIAQEQQKELYETEKNQIEQNEKNINEEINQKIQDIAQRKAQQLAEIEAHFAQGQQAIETEEITLSEQQKQELIEQKRAEKQLREQQNLQKQAEINTMEKDLNNLLQQQKDALQSQINLAQTAQNNIENQLQQTKQELLQAEQMVTITEAEKNELVQTTEKNRQNLQQDIHDISNDLANAQEELNNLRQEELRIKEKLLIPQAPKEERLIQKEKLEEGGEPAIPQQVEIQKPTEIIPVESSLIREEKTPFMPPPVIAPETIKIPPITVPFIEVPEKVEVQPAPTVAAAPITTTAPAPTYTPPYHLPSLLHKRDGVPRTTVPSAQPSYRPSDITTIVEPFKPWEHEKPREEARRAGFTYQPPYVPAYEEPRRYPTGEKYIGGYGGQVEETYEIPYTTTVTEARKTPSLQSKLARQIPEQLEVPIIEKEEEQPIEVIQEEWKPLPKKIWPKKPQVEKEVMPETPQVNWFRKLIMRIIEYINKLFGK